MYTRMKVFTVSILVALLMVVSMPAFSASAERLLGYVAHQKAAYTDTVLTRKVFAMVGENAVELVYCFDPNPECGYTYVVMGHARFILFDRTVQHYADVVHHTIQKFMGETRVGRQAYYSMVAILVLQAIETGEIKAVLHGQCFVPEIPKGIDKACVRHYVHIARVSQSW